MKKPEPCDFCGEPSIGFYVIYEWSEELQTNVSISGAYVCKKCKREGGYED